MSRVPFDVNTLTNLSEEEREQAKRLLRPVISTPGPNFDAEQLWGFLSQLNEAYGSARTAGATAPPTLQALLKARGMTSAPPPRLRAAG